MAVYLLDTDHLSYVQERHPRVIDQLIALPSDARVMTSVISVAELLRGVYLLSKGRRQRELLSLYQQVIERMEEVLPMTREVAETFARIDAALRKKGRRIPVNDVWVAALAQSEDAILVTNDEHFNFVENLKRENWAR